jgi:hypothetical protein
MRFRVDPKADPSWVDEMLAKIRGRVPQPELTDEQRSLVKLAHSAIRLHASALAKGVVPRTEDGASQPLALALTSLNTVMKGMRHG